MQCSCPIKSGRSIINWRYFFIVFIGSNFDVNTLNITFVMKEILAEVVCNFNVTTLSLLQLTVISFDNILPHKLFHLTKS